MHINKYNRDAQPHLLFINFFSIKVVIITQKCNVFQ